MSPLRLRRASSVLRALPRNQRTRRSAHRSSARRSEPTTTSLRERRSRLTRRGVVHLPVLDLPSVFFKTELLVCLSTVRERAPATVNRSSAGPFGAPRCPAGGESTCGAVSRKYSPSAGSGRLGAPICTSVAEGHRYAVRLHCSRREEHVRHLHITMRIDENYALPRVPACDAWTSSIATAARLGKIGRRQARSQPF